MKKILVAAVLSTLAIQLSAQSMGFLNVNPDAASAAVAGASVARPANAWAAESNVAATALSADRMAFGAGYGIYQPNASKTSVISAAGFVRLGEKLSFAAGFKNFGEPEYSVTSIDGRATGTFKPSEMAFGAGAAYRISNSLSAGVFAKMASSTLAKDAKASTFGVDVSAAYSSDAINAGLSVNNIGGKVNYGGADYDLPMIVKAGAAYKLSSLVASAEIDYMLSGAFMAAAGAEYWIKDILALRAGYHYGPADAGIPSYVSAGIGAKFSGITLNAAYLLASESIGGTMMFGIGYSF